MIDTNWLQDVHLPLERFSSLETLCIGQYANTFKRARVEETDLRSLQKLRALIIKTCSAPAGFRLPPQLWSASTTALLEEVQGIYSSAKSKQSAVTESGLQESQLCEYLGLSVLSILLDSVPRSLSCINLVLDRFGKSDNPSIPATAA